MYRNGMRGSIFVLVWSTTNVVLLWSKKKKREISQISPASLDQSDVQIIGLYKHQVWVLFFWIPFFFFFFNPKSVDFSVFKHGEQRCVGPQESLRSSEGWKLDEDLCRWHWRGLTLLFFLTSLGGGCWSGSGGSISKQSHFWIWR